jgi:hypothetical protein
MAFAQQDFLDAVYAALAAECPEIEIYSTAISPNAPTPYIVFSIVGDLPAIYFGSATDDFRILVQVTLYDKRDGSAAQTGGFRELRVLGERVKSALHKKILTVANTGNVSGWCTRRSTCRNEADNFNSLSHEFLFIGSES